MSDEVVVERSISWWGLFHLHVMRMGGEVDMLRWIEREVLAAGGAVQTFYRYEEKELGVWHLHLWWKMPGYQVKIKTVTPVEVLGVTYQLSDGGVNE